METNKVIRHLEHIIYHHPEDLLDELEALEIAINTINTMNEIKDLLNDELNQEEIEWVMKRSRLMEVIIERIIKCKNHA